MQQLIGIQFNPIGKIYDYLAHGSDIKTGDIVIVDTPFSGVKAVKVVRVTRPHSCKSYAHHKFIVKHIPQQNKESEPMIDNQQEMEDFLTTEKFCVIATHSHNAFAGSRTWFSTKEQAEAHARNIIKSRHQLGNNKPIALMIVKTVSTVRTPEPEIIVKNVEALKIKKAKKKARK